MASRYEISTIFRGIDAMTAPCRNMAKSIQKVSFASRNLSNNLQGVNNVAKKITSTAGGISKAFSLVSAASLGGVAAINKYKFKTDSLSRSMGANIETVEALSFAIKDFGLDSENVTDLYEEMRNKFGESGSLGIIKPVEESLTMLGLKFKELKSLAPEGQLQTILNAALKMKDASKAASALDILMGDQSNKVVSALKLRYKSMDEIIRSYKELSFRTDSSRVGAEAMAKSQSRLFSIVVSLSQEISGLAGNALTPLISQLNKFLVKNKEIINQRLVDFFKNLGNSIKDISPKIDGAYQSLINMGEGFKKTLLWAKWIGGVTVAVVGLSAAMNVATGAIAFFTAISSLNPVLLAITGAIVGITAASAVLYSNWEGISEAVSDWWGRIKTSFDLGVNYIKDKINQIKGFFGFSTDANVNVNTIFAKPVGEIIDFVPAADTVQSISAAQAAPVVQTATAFQPMQSIQSMPAPQAAPIVQPIPTAQVIDFVAAADTVQSISAAQAAPIVQTAPAVQPMQSVQASPIVQPMPAVQASPIVQPMQSVQASPIVQPIPTAQVIDFVPAANSFQESNNAGLNRFGGVPIGASYGNSEEMPDANASVISENVINREEIVQKQMTTEIQRVLTENKQSIEINVKGSGGVDLSTPDDVPNLNLINTGS